MRYEFDAELVAPSMGNFAVLPAGDYQVVLKKANERENRARNGTHTELFFEVIDGPCRGKQIVDRLNLAHMDPATKGRAQARLSALCHSIGVLKIRSLMDLANIPLSIKVIEKTLKEIAADPNNPLPPKVVNEVTDFRKIERQQAGNQPSVPAPQASGAVNKSWM